MHLQVKLLSETTFGRGEGTAGFVDTEIDHDPTTGLPFIGARTLKGLLVEACSEVFYTLGEIDSPNRQKLEDAALFLFGVPGSTLETDAMMKIGHATFSDAFQQAVRASAVPPQTVLESWTYIRTQTAASVLGVPDEGSLRAVRVLRRGTTLHAPLAFSVDPDETSLALLDAVARLTQRAGLNRNRGRGRLAVRLMDNDGSNSDRLETFERLLNGEAA